MDKTYYIFRHGLAVKAGEEYGENNMTTPLLPKGVNSTKKMAEYFLKNVSESINFSSAWLRCQQTSKIIAGATGKQFTTDTRLNEYYMEEFNSVCLRVESFLKNITSMNDSRFLICTHGSIISALKYLITTGKFDENNLFDYPLPGELLIIKNNKVEKVLSFN